MLLLLFLDDLHRGDSATLEVLEYAGKRWAEQGAPVLVLIAARTEEPEASSALERWLLALGRRLPVRSLALVPWQRRTSRFSFGGLLMQAHRLSPLTGPWRRWGLKRGGPQARAIGGMASCGDGRAALLPGGDDKGSLRRGHAPHTKPRTGRRSWM